MRYFFLFWQLSLISSLINAQTHKQDIHDLKIYSYQISGDTILGIEQGHMQGTGFFINRENGIFFVCAKHTVSGCNDKNLKDIRSPHTMNINVADNVLQIDVKQIKDSASCLPLVLDPDIVSIPLDSVQIKEHAINIINDLEGNLPSNSSELVIWGFPNSAAGISLFNSKKYSIITDVPVVLDGWSFTDVIHYCVGIEDSSVEGLAGYSGSPVLLRDTNSNKFVFIGILVGTHVPANGLYVVRPKYLYSLIN